MGMVGQYAITAIRAREVLDSRATPTIEVEITTNSGATARAIAPSGASTGAYEAVELRDGARRFNGNGVQKAVGNVNRIIAPKLVGTDVGAQREIDALLCELDGTPNKARLGANATVATSIACAKAAAAARGKWAYAHINPKATLLPVPFCNVINGGKHAEGGADIQEYMIAPVGARSFAEAMQIVAEVYRALAKRLEKTFGKTAARVGDEGGFAPPFKDAAAPLDELERAVEQAGWKKQVRFALDVAATSFHTRAGTYSFEGKAMRVDALSQRLAQLSKDYKIISIEDPFEENAFEDFARFTRKNPHIQVVGDDLLVTQKKRVSHAVHARACNALLLKTNQCGTLSEALDAASTATRAGWNVMVSHRSGETEDAFIADLSVALDCGQIKAGAPARGERTAKYNQLLRIEEHLGKKARYAGKQRKIF